MYDKVKVIRLTNLRELEAFVKAADDCDFDIDVKYNRVIIDAKSLLGMIGLGLRKDIEVCYGGNNEKFENLVDKFAVA
ncbi:MAG: HPr family phosphocarrier protein [Blautia sp.]|nr:HPr family phosphocarrier protein [Blautia sp.]MCM1282006.1 HPr family phosphocarrier protein [Roseburia sp.]MCM1430204.1 HPr family phosphocarrier protein [Muribaculaceae bacterium]